MFKLPESEQQIAEDLPTSVNQHSVELRRGALLWRLFHVYQQCSNYHQNPRIKHSISVIRAQRARLSLKCLLNDNWNPLLIETCSRYLRRNLCTAALFKRLYFTKSPQENMIDILREGPRLSQRCLKPKYHSLKNINVIVLCCVSDRFAKAALLHSD